MLLNAVRRQIHKSLGVKCAYLRGLCRSPTGRVDVSDKEKRSRRELGRPERTNKSDSYLQDGK